MTQPKTASKFTPGAMRAALDVYADMYGVEAATLAPGETTTKWAKIIDRQTKAPEMYDLLEQLADRARGVVGALDIGYSTWKSLCHKARRIKAEIDGE